MQTTENSISMNEARLAGDLFAHIFRNGEDLMIPTSSEYMTQSDKGKIFYSQHIMNVCCCSKQ